MSDNFPQTPGSGRNIATDQVTYSGDTADVQLVRLVYISGAEGSKTAGEIVDANGQWVHGSVAHDGVDAGNPMKFGGKAANAFPTAVANADRANIITDLWGRQLTAEIDPAMQKWVSFNATSTQTGVDVIGSGTSGWSLTSGKKIAITWFQIGTYGTTAARVILWFGDNADTTYTAGTDQLVFAGSFAPTTSSKPGVVVTPRTPIFCTTADRELHLTTDAGISIDITVYGYEW